jgi:DNA-binding transcriptional LysR family regulator
MALMDWDDIRYALAVARAGNVARAARSLGVAHTTVARRIAAFEAQLGVPLFDRVAGDCTLTVAGKDLLEVGTEIEARANAFERRLSSRDAALEGDVRIATVEPLAAKLTEYVLTFARMHPKIRVHVHTTNANVDLAKREADVALRISSAPDESLVGRRLASIAFAVYGSASGPPATTDLKTREWICFDATSAQTPQGKWELENVPADRVVLRTNSRVVFYEAVAAGAGVGILPCGVAAQIPSLVALTPPIAALTLPLWLLTHADLQHTPRVRALLDFLGDVFDREKALIEGTSVPG